MDMRALIGIGEDLAASPSHTTVRTGHVHGGSTECIPTSPPERVAPELRSTALAMPA